VSVTPAPSTPEGRQALDSAPQELPWPGWHWSALAVTLLLDGPVSAGETVWSLPAEEVWEHDFHVLEDMEEERALRNSVAATEVAAHAYIQDLTLQVIKRTGDALEKPLESQEPVDQSHDVSSESLSRSPSPFLPPVPKATATYNLSSLNTLPDPRPLFQEIGVLMEWVMFSFPLWTNN
jgi:hypothetical protein